jgi:hypothetical protein
MPCDQERSIGVNLESADTLLMKEALETLGYTVTPSTNAEGGLFFTRRALPDQGVSAITGRAAPGKFNLLGMVVMPSETLAVKMAYAWACTRAACTRFKWRLPKPDARNRVLISKQGTEGTDLMQIEVLPDGAIKVTTDFVSAPNHVNAEGLLKLMSRLMGGETAITRRRDHPADSRETLRERR